MKDFVKYDLALKLKEKGFITTEPFAMYQLEDIDTIYPLYTSDPYYYDLDDFDEYSFVAPTISQVLKWLREEKKYHVEFVGNACGYLFIVSDIPSEGGTDRYCSDYSGPNDGGTWDTYEDCALAGIEYVLDNLI